MMTNEVQDVTVTLDDLVSLLDKRYELVYIDYRDNLDEHMKEIQEAIQKQDWTPIDELTNDWFWESEADSVDYILTHNLPDELERAYDWDDPSEIDDLIEQYREELTEEIYERNEGDPVGDLLRNTSDPVCFYDTGLDLPETCFMESEEVQEYIDAIRSTLGIEGFDRELSMMLCQASYGGRLVIYFRHDIRDLMKLENMNTVTFKNAAIAIIDTYNGSGDDTRLPGTTISLPFDPANLFIDKTFKYSYTYDVCAMSSSWCDCTDVSFSHVDHQAPIVPSSLHAELEVEAEYIKAYKAGGCTLGDMDMNRHRNTYYENEFPCGTHCPHCGTFWID